MKIGCNPQTLFVSFFPPFAQDGQLTVRLQNQFLMHGHDLMRLMSDLERQRKIMSVARPPLRSRGVMFTIMGVFVVFASLTNSGFADEIWSCTPDLKAPNPHEKNLYISKTQLWFADATVTFEILENNAEHIIAYNVHASGTKSSKMKPVGRDIILLERASGNITEIDETNLFQLPEEDNTPSIWLHWICARRQ